METFTASAARYVSRLTTRAPIRRSGDVLVMLLDLG
jgi:hypothetical protein